MAYTEKITLKIDVNKIDKNAIYRGEKGNYITLTIIPTPNNQYNDYMVKQYIKGQEDPILGNGSDLIFDEHNNGGQGAPQKQEGGSAEQPADNDLPF